LNISSCASGGIVFVNVECIKGYAFKMAEARVNCALLPVLTANFGRTQDKCAHFSRLECLSPHDIAC